MINNAKSLNYLSHAVCGRRHSKPFIHISMTQKLNFGNLHKKGRRILKDLICNLSCIFIKIFKLRTFENKIFFFIIYLLCFWKILNEPKNDGTAESTGLSNHEKEGNIKIISVKL